MTAVCGVNYTAKKLSTTVDSLLQPISSKLLETVTVTTYTFFLLLYNTKSPHLLFNVHLSTNLHSSTCHCTCLYICTQTRCRVKSMTHIVNFEKIHKLYIFDRHTYKHFTVIHDYRVQAVIQKVTVYRLQVFVIKKHI